MADLQEPIRTVKALQGQVLQQDQTLTLADVDNERVYESGSGDIHLDISSQTYKTSIDRIRDSPVALNPNVIYKTYENGFISGEWQIDPLDTTSADNGYSVLVVVSTNQRLKITSGVTMSDEIFDI